MNVINTIRPYKFGSSWVFDDERVALYREAFVSGADAMIDALVNDIPDSGKGFTLVFSADQFPGWIAQLTHLRPEFGGNWYSMGDMEGWLCSAMFKYFDHTPERIYVRVQP